MKKMVTDVLQGENRLLYTYGVTNSGKTYTIQGKNNPKHISKKLWFGFVCVLAALWNVGYAFIEPSMLIWPAECLESKCKV